ncbi:aminotransferase, putative [Talaromyces stipitatus ATCC 10500]|uniref:Aminotransferase, putative n=1 Tax=Talaromyces stipitatus (strain ATCC 10500 / CBS 375.48 / QM 6759 / NRRL 1006) TaxID=441959 RepID=B8M0K7_TALSN|nr:aminotransferase, putative [Talaromyces stipitatus ATCC 10500]EED21304.1 aminotransferase, putative [Talaromyces stipitatus ATCC 10500]
MSQAPSGANSCTSNDTHINQAQTKYPIDLFRGWPNPALLPVDALAKSAATVLSSPSIYESGLQYGPDEGYGPLREHIASWLGSFYRDELESEKRRRNPITAERLCVTGGASQNLACVLQVFTDSAYTRNIWMVAPTYYLACRIFHDAGFMGRLRGVPEDEEGIDLDVLERGLQEAEDKAASEGNTKPVYTLPRPWSKIYKHVIYLTPTFANPSMKVASLRRREGLVQLARRFDALIISDDVYDFLQWPSDPNATDIKDTACVPRLVDVDGYLDGGPIDEWGNAMSNGSFSKLIGPGMRVGWAEGTEKFAYGLSQAGSSRSGGAPSQLSSTFVDQLLPSGILQRHIKQELIPAYRARYNRIISAINDHLLPLGFKLPAGNQPISGGYFIWLDLPLSLTGDLLAQRALADEMLMIGSGTMFQVQDDCSENHQRFERSIRLCFAYERFEVLYEGVERLGNVARRMLTER